MNQKELNEIRRRFRLDKNSISRIYGCYVNANGEIVSYLDTSLGFLPQEEQEVFLTLLKKSLSGTLGKNLLDIEFATRQVIDGQEHHMLQALRESALADEAARMNLYQAIIDSHTMGDANYLILLAADAYDVPYKAKDDSFQADASDTVFRYFVCSVCPVKDPATGLCFDHAENSFHCCNIGSNVDKPTLGFMFPTFDDRAANIYNALYYVRKPEELHRELIDGLFKVEPPMSAVEQKNVFDAALCDTLDTDLSYDVVQSVHEQIRGRIDDHKESHDPEPLELSIAEVGSILSHSGASEERVRAFQEECQRQYGDTATLDPNNIIESKKFLIETPEVKITVSPEYSYLIETRTIGERKYLLIPAEDGVEVNGISVTLN